jgi:DNA polymerase-4
MWNVSLKKTDQWPRAISLIDMNAFFASVEQKDCPEWRGQPIGVTNGAQGTCIITCSYEARAYGVQTGMRLVEARQLCPHLIQAASRPHRYVEISTAIMEALTAITPEIEIFSIDEAFLDVTDCQQVHGPPEVMGRMAQGSVFSKAWRLHLR